MRSTPARRIQGFRPTVFAEMSELSARHGAVNLGQGFPDFTGPGFVMAAASRAIEAGHNQYAHPHGVRSLREAIASDWRTRFAMDLDPDRHVTVTSGATEAIFDTMMALVDPGDEVVTFEPFYDSYPASVLMAEGIIKAVRLRDPDWRFSREELELAISPRTRLLLLNTPHNPTGKVFSAGELRMVAEVAIERDLVVVTDEVYDRILFDGTPHVPIASLPGMWERTLTINSTGKTFSLTGWKVGYAVGPEHLQWPLRSVHQFVTFATATPFQVAMAEAMLLAATNGYYDDLAEEYHERREVLADVLHAAGLPPLPVAGSYFLQASFAHLPFKTDVDFCRWLITTLGVTPIPPSAFYLEPATAPKLARFCFAKKVETLREAGTRLEGIGAALASVAAD